MKYRKIILILAAVALFGLVIAVGCVCPYAILAGRMGEAENTGQNPGDYQGTETTPEETGIKGDAGSQEETGAANDAWGQQEGSWEYTRSEIEYFLETAMGAEYGEHDSAVHKWVDNIRIDIKGDPTDEDMETLELVIYELNYLIDGITISIVNWDANIDMYFTRQEKFYSIEPNYVTGNIGFFWAWWDEMGALYKARILIATDGITQKERDHLIWEELTQTLGIMNDSYEYQDSIFYQGWSDVSGYAEIDKAVISILYDPRLEPGMSLGEVQDMLY